MNIVAHWGFVCKLFLLRKGALTVENKIITKNKMKRIFTHLFVAVLLMLSTTSWAQLSSLEVGQIYRFKSARADRSLRADGVDDVHTKTTDPNDKAQEWYVTKDGDYYVLRNVACGRFLKGAPSAYTAWSLTEDYSANENRFSLLTSKSTLNTLKTKGSDDYGHMHDDNNGDNGGYNVVGWLNGDGNTGSHWTITKVNYTAEQIKALLDAAPTIAEVAAYQPSLEALFSDAACTTPKLASLSAAQNSEAYAALPAALQRMVDKVYGDNWAEATVAPADRPNGIVIDRPEVEGVFQLRKILSVYIGIYQLSGSQSVIEKAVHYPVSQLRHRSVGGEMGIFWCDRRYSVRCSDRLV